jgi:hypothetical protein
LKTFARVACTYALSVLSLRTLPSATAAQAPNPMQSSTVRDGSHDFDFIYGKWRMPNHRLKKRLAGSNEWDDFITCDEGSPLPGGIGDIDYWKASYWKDFVGVTVRTYDPKTGLWRIYWVDNKFSGGVIQPPVLGKFDANVGIFEGPDTFNGIPILMRFTWTVNPKASEAAKWEQTLNQMVCQSLRSGSRRSRPITVRRERRTGTTNLSKTTTAPRRRNSVTELD